MGSADGPVAPGREIGWSILVVASEASIVEGHQLCTHIRGRVIPVRVVMLGDLGRRRGNLNGHGRGWLVLLRGHGKAGDDAKGRAAALQ